MFSLIVAHDANFAIGKDNQIPWHLSEDLKQFKRRTLNHRIVMGKVTFDGFSKPLKKRHTVVACFPGQEKEDTEDVTYCTDLKAFLEENQDTEEEIFICGGASIYRFALPYCKKLYISLVEGEHEADTYFPHYDVSDYEIASVTPYDGFKVVEYVKKEEK
ncbi:MAG: dihydrofolate reductase [Erysipelotrichaceae bacterium]|nr:dihydrofolate reductase [Erysipelotrichaceae bacterium]